MKQVSLPVCTGMPVTWHTHDGGHIWPKDCTALMVKFFKEQALQEKR